MAVGGLLLRMTGRYLVRHGWQTGLSVLGIALGVAVVVAVDLANQSARRAFELSMETLTGRASHHIVGGPTGFDERLYTRLRVERGLRETAPVVEGLVDLRGRTMRLLGVDPLAEGGSGRGLAGPDGDAIRRLLTEPDTVLLSRGAGRRLGVDAGEPLALEVAGRGRTVRVVGFIEPRRAGAGGDLLVADIATAQEVLGRVGRLDRIDLFLPEGAQGRLQALEAALPEGVRVEAAAARRGAALELTRAFQTNLTAMSLLALLVGGFLIYNTMTFSV
ncbi:MAG TPA: ABC transporter permease, partial [Gammaproteobacteria bacterium]|nr:ABC transporter permease [Gammaproteobacteria bacterium]